MPVPKYYQFFPSILDCLADGKEHNLKEVAEYCANKFNLSDEDKREALPSGQPTYLNRVGWARTYLKKAGLTDRTSRSVYIITDLGEEAVKNGKKFEFPITGWGMDLSSEHERYLVEEHFKRPVIMTDYPSEIKAFYMKKNPDGKTMQGTDVLFPRIGEIIGGSVREEDYKKLVGEIKARGMEEETYSWYLDTRKFGSCPHAGFGLGFERLILFVTGMQNIRDVIPFPRTPKNAMF